MATGVISQSICSSDSIYWQSNLFPVSEGNNACEYTDAQDASVFCYTITCCLQLPDKLADLLRARTGDHHHGVGCAHNNEIFDADERGQAIAGMHHAAARIHRHNRALQHISRSVGSCDVKKRVLAADIRPAEIAKRDRRQVGFFHHGIID